MKVIVFEKHGAPEELRVQERPTPAPGAGSVLVRVHAAGVNFADSMIRRGVYPAPAAPPYVPGMEIAGVVAAVGEGVQRARPGDRVAAVLMQGGGYAEYAVVPEAALVPLPDGISEPNALALLVQGLTAHALVEAVGGPLAGKAALVTAAAGGVGTLLVQLLRRAGAEVVAGLGGSGSGGDDDEKAALVRELGAAYVVRYGDAGWTEAVSRALGGRAVDVAFDSVGGDVARGARSLLGHRGALVVYGAASGGFAAVTPEELSAMLFQNQRLIGLALPALVAADPTWQPRALAELFSQTAAGALRPIVHPPFPLTDAAAAHALLDARRTRGKVVLVTDAGRAAASA